MTTAKERKALLAYAAWWRGEGLEVEWLVVLPMMPDIQDLWDNGHVAESLAYDGTDGP